LGLLKTSSIGTIWQSLGLLTSVKPPALRGRSDLPSLQEYVLIEQDIVTVQVLRRSNHWQSEYFFLGDSVTFESIGYTLAVDVIYDRVDNRDMNEFRQQLLLPEGNFY
jgi:hypothetical protein